MREHNLGWASALVLLASCAHAPPPEPAHEPVRAAEPEKPAPAPAGPKSCALDSDCTDGQLCIRGTCVDISSGLKECRDFHVNFGFNSTDFDAASKPDLDRMARCLRAAQAMRVMIEGNADERGTEEYNLQLGSKRASTIEKYLLALGTTPAQVNTISYGENRPVCRQQDEACWAKNRRAEVKQPEPAKPEKKNEKKK